MIRVLVITTMMIGTGSEAMGAERILAAGGSITEIIYALGAQNRLIAVDSTSNYPPEAADLPSVGYVRQLSAEPVIALAPDLVLAEGDAGPAAALEQIEGAGIELAIVADPPTAEGVLEKIHVVARALGMQEEGAALAHRVSLEFQRLKEDQPTYEHPPRVLFVMSSSRGAPLAAGEATEAAAIIEMAGAANALSGFTGYKPLSPEAAIEAAPDVILVMDSTKRRMGEAAIFALPGISETPAGRHARVISMEGMLLLGFGPRTPKAVAALRSALLMQTASR